MTLVSEHAARRIARSTGQDVALAWHVGGPLFVFVTTDHRHGKFTRHGRAHRRSGDRRWRFYTPAEEAAAHTDVCDVLFPGWADRWRA